MKSEYAPTRKVAGGGIGAAIGILAVWLIGLTGIVIPPEVAAAISTITGFFTGYMVREHPLT